MARTIGQEPYEIEYIPAQLQGYVLEWGAYSYRLNYSDADWKSLDDVVWTWLGIRRTGNPVDVVNCALVKLDGPQHHKLQVRESHYQELNVTDDILVNGIHYGNYFRSFGTEVIAFAPDPSKSVNDLTGKRVAVRAGYYERAEEYLRVIHPDKDARLPDLPAGVELLEGYQTNDRVLQEFWKKVETPQLDNYNFELDKYLRDNHVTRHTNWGAVSIPYGPIPCTLGKLSYDGVAKAAEGAVSISAKAHRLVLHDQWLFDLNGYTEVDRILTSPQLASNFADLPTLARVDICMIGDKLIVFEVNADSAAGMLHSDALAARQWLEIQLRELTGDLVDLLEPPRNEGVCDAVVEAFIRGWEQYLEQKSDPEPGRKPRRIAIVDRDIDKVVAYTEFEHFRNLFLERVYGIVEEGPRERNTRSEVVILDIKDLRYRKDHRELTDSSGRPIDAVYKRLLWQEAIDIGEGGLDSDFCQAYLDDSVYVMNSFRSRLAGSKLNMAIAKSPSFEARCNDIGIELTDNEKYVLQNNMPETLLWGPNPLDDRDPQELKDYVMSHITDYVLKVHHGMGGNEFVNGAPPFGAPPSPAFLEKWEEGKFIAQRRQEHGMIDMPIYQGRQKGSEWGQYWFILGAYVVDGKCVGVEAKFADEIPININNSARRTAVFSLKA